MESNIEGTPQQRGTIVRVKRMRDEEVSEALGVSFFRSLGVYP
jgi:hypothetical protein